MNAVALRANDVLRNDVMLRINDVALRANGISPSTLAKHLKLCYNKLGKAVNTVRLCREAVRGELSHKRQACAMRFDNKIFTF